MSMGDRVGVLNEGIFGVDCASHSGAHLWQDACIAEIIPQAELQREKASPGCVPDAVFLPDAAPGLTGELVITNFAEALPLVRYRTGNMVEVPAEPSCACGSSAPRVRVLEQRAEKPVVDTPSD
jgi:phenylacetate-coenzyme A ligase PaaK-like adenylate-forming protein